MASKLFTVAAAGAGYVLGARAGRERYETIKEQTNQFLRNPRVRKAASNAQDFAAEQAPVAGQKAKEAAGKAKARVSSSDEDSSSNPSGSKTTGGGAAASSAGDVSGARAGTTSGPSTSTATGPSAAPDSAGTGTSGRDVGKHA